MSSTPSMPSTPSTKAALATLGDFAQERRLLVVLSRDEENAWRSLRNVANIHAGLQRSTERLRRRDQ
ncbi:MAG: hypothetical protein V9E98_11560 [Candidatus Nanopelagicales bacterium]